MRAEGDAAWQHSLDRHGATVFQSFKLMTGLMELATERATEEPETSRRIMRCRSKTSIRHGKSKLQSMLMAVESDDEAAVVIRDNAGEATPELAASAIDESRRLLRGQNPIAAMIAGLVLRRARPPRRVSSER